VVFPDGTGVNPGTKLVKAPSYPGIADDYRRTIRLLESLKPDIFLSFHSEFFDLEGKCARGHTRCPGVVGSRGVSPSDRGREGGIREACLARETGAMSDPS